MKGKSKFAGRARLYAPSILAIFVFIAVIVAEYLIVQSMIKESREEETQLYHGAISQIIDNIDRYELETASSIYPDSLGLLAFMKPVGFDNSFVQIIHDSVGYRELMRLKLAGGIFPDLHDLENTIIETSVGKTDNNELVLMMTQESTNQTNKKLEKIAVGLIIALIAMIIITLVPGALLIESLGRRSSMMNALAPDSSESDFDFLHEGILNSSSVSFLIASTDGSLLSANSSCVELLEIGGNLQGLSIASITALPSEIRKKKSSTFLVHSHRSITIQSMDGSTRECSMEVHPYRRDDSVIAVLFLFVPSEIDEFIPVSDIASSDQILTSMYSRTKSHLVKSLIHDMNNYIFGIMGAASIEAETAVPSEKKKPFKIILESAEKLAALCTDLQTTLSGTNNKKLRDLSSEMVLIVEVLRNVLPERVEVEVVGNSTSLIKADRELLREFFYGLVLNSTAIMNGEGRIRIDISERIPRSGNSFDAIAPGEKVCLRYSDGFIMPVALRDVLSNCNYSVSDVERQYGATIGNAYKALSKLTGSIVFERGSGETVLCLLLDGYEQLKPESDTDSRSPGNSHTPGLSVLIADEVEIVLNSMSEYLELNKISVTRAHNGDQAMQLLRSEDFDAAVLDLNMPGVPTPGIVRFCQTSKPEMAVIVTSGFEASQEVQDLIVAPSTEYLHKPHKPDVLIDMIYSLISKSKEGSTNADY